ncbi:hypothetical protein ACRRTK_023959 [Alexandromys fortis]
MQRVCGPQGTKSEVERKGPSCGAEQTVLYSNANEKPGVLLPVPRAERGEPAPGSRGERGAQTEERRRARGSGATYGGGGGCGRGGGGPSAGPGRRGRTAEAPRLRRAGLRWAPSWSAPRARPPRRASPCIIDDSSRARPRRRAPPPPGPRATLCARPPLAAPAPARSPSRPSPAPSGPPDPRPPTLPGAPARLPSRYRLADLRPRAPDGMRAGARPAGGAAPERLPASPGPPPRRPHGPRQHRRRLRCSAALVYDKSLLAPGHTRSSCHSS